MNVLAVLGALSLWLTVVFSVVAFFGPAAKVGLGQTRRGAIIEVWINIIIGFSLNFVVNLGVMPLVGAQLTAASNFWMGCIFTAVSVVRSFVIRRYFERGIHRVSMALGGKPD